MRVALLTLALVAVASPAAAADLTIRTGETWIFRIENGQPARARKVAASTTPKKGEVRASVSAMLGTLMTISNNSPTAYTFRAQLVGANGKSVAARSCTLPANNRPAFESWPNKSVAVRIGSFRKAADGGSC